MTLTANLLQMPKIVKASEYVALLESIKLASAKLMKLCSKLRGPKTQSWTRYSKPLGKASAIQASGDKVTLSTLKMACSTVSFLVTRRDPFPPLFTRTASLTPCSSNFRAAFSTCSLVSVASPIHALLLIPLFEALINQYYFNVCKKDQDKLCHLPALFHSFTAAATLSSAAPDFNFFGSRTRQSALFFSWVLKLGQLDNVYSRIRQRAQHSTGKEIR